MAVDLTEAAREVAARSRSIGRPYVWLRAFTYLLVAALVIAPASLLGLFRFDAQTVEALRAWAANPGGVAQTLESVVNLVILAGAAGWFLLTLEQRLKRGRALEALHELRSFAHVIDMHQLTKDPTVLLGAGQPTASSPKRRMTEFELTRYLEYCAEMLALVGKLAALYGEYTRDAAVIDATTDIERLATDLGRKTWQKISIIGNLDERRQKSDPAQSIAAIQSGSSPIRASDT